MAVYPVNLNIEGKPCAVIGGGKVAYRKVKALLKAKANVTVISPMLVDELTQFVEQAAIMHSAKVYSRGDLNVYFLVICATDHSEVNQKAALEAKKAGALVNIVDDESYSDFIVPAQVSRGDLLFTVSTGGKSPALARQLRAELADTYGMEYEMYLDLVARIRSELKENLRTSQERGEFWEKAMNQNILDLLRQGKLNEAEARIKDAIGSIGSES
ncbi:precorrin-2 dehydrogenase/sirohydrochlorin ferrochelatase family protein [Anaerosinus massiliensis]|uniref:precorrin-2 dehydrogenase/sirohydrochlorin ferrochelatase family protein n=1 Tax=Massilibacillus massiliensis TaxID=1806837 RepID=UPI000DA5F69A|nr:bifunctional precorrin-2 dehydrogenase/sirohydrochlorin ferrochelatase [Massilibacillus massiliensis]